MTTKSPPVPAVLPGAGLPGRGRWSRPNVVAVGALTTVIAGLYSVVSCFGYYTFQTASYDLVIFDQAIRSYAHFQPGISIVKGIHNGFGPHFSVLGDHFSPIIASLAPLYWIDNSPVNLLVAQSVLLALAIPPIWVFTRRAFGGGRKATVAAYLVSVAYGLSWPLASAATFNFHEVAFAPVLTALALERLQAGKLRPALIWLGLLLLVKEDMGFLVAGIGGYLIVSRQPVLRRQRLVGIGLLVAGVAYSVFAVYVMIPAFGGRSNYYWAYGALGQNVPQVVAHLITHPFSALHELVTPYVKVRTMLWLFGALCFLPLASPLVLAAVPLLAERLLGSRYHNWWITRYQYNAFVLVPLMLAAVDGAARLDRWVTRWWASGEGEPAPLVTRMARRLRSLGPGTVGLAGAVALCVAAVWTVPLFSLGPALHSSYYHRSGWEQAAAAAVAVVPGGVTVAAPNRVGPQLTSRDTVLVWDAAASYRRARPTWVIANVGWRQLWFTGVPQQQQAVQTLERSGYRVVFTRGGYLVLHRAGPPSAPGSGG